MSSNTDKLQRLIESVVRAEVKRQVPALVKEILAGMLVEAALNGGLAQTTPASGNSHKRHALQEASMMHPSEMEEYPTPDRTRMASLLGYGDMVPPGRSPAAPNGKELIVSSAHTENGTAVPVDPRTLPDHVVNALTRDYRDVMKALDKKSG